MGKMLTRVTPADLLMEQPTKSDSVVIYSPTATPSRARPMPSCGPTRPTQPIAATPSHLPIGRPVEPTEVADLVVFLASRRAGAIIPIDGGSAEGCIRRMGRGSTSQATEANLSVAFPNGRVTRRASPARTPACTACVPAC